MIVRGLSHERLSHNIIVQAAGSRRLESMIRNNPYRSAVSAK
jgi:hypothetical protein